ncbi:MAG: ABC transporter ATP-binding protein [Alphaproteobacteria bacterium]|nr:ABC transporter ATP-binding protein [Alphaproteobacteria bacterium]
MENTIHISSLYKQFADVCAVDKISFSAQTGDVIALLGPNGAGKSTLMNMIAGLLSADDGDIIIDGFNIKQNPTDAKKLIGFLAEGAPMYGDMRVKNFLSYMADLKGILPKDKIQRLTAVKEMAQIADVWNMKIETLSKGYQRRVGFAQSILSDPPILLLDEPTDGLDPNQKEHIRQLVKQLGEHKIILISTHLLDDVEQMCNRIMIMNRGAIIADGVKQKILEQAKAFSLESAFRKLTGGSYV